jgi:cell division protein FtsB
MPPEDQELTPPAVSAEDARAEVERLKRKNQELLEEKARLKDKVRSIPEGVDVDELLRFKQETERQALESKGDYDKARQQLQEQYDRDTGALKAQIAELKAEVRDLKLITPAASVLAQVVHDPDYLFSKGLIKPEQIEQGPDGPVFVDGLKRVPLADYALEVAPAYLRKAPRPTGSGAPAGGSTAVAGDLTAGVKNPFTREHFNLGEQERIFQSNPALYQQLLAAAKAGMGRS